MACGVSPVADGFGKYEVYAVAGSLYCYQGTAVLRNRFGIRDAGQLRALEADISSARQTEMMNEPVRGRFTANHLKAIHHKLLSDVYSFAGHFRREDIAKGETRFLSYTEISDKLEKLLAELRKERWLGGLGRDDLTQRAAYYMAELNYIHPFREGNGRAIRELMRLLFLRNGYAVRWDNVPTETLLQAMVDSVYDTADLKRVLAECVGRV